MRFSFASGRLKGILGDLLLLVTVQMLLGWVESDSRDEQRKLCITQIAEEYEKVVYPLIAGKEVHLMDMVCHYNFGDSFIEYGERLFLEKHGKPVTRWCSVKSCPETDILRDLKANPSGSVVLIHGGGNFGDIYKFLELYHNALVKRYRHYPLVFLPQSIHYRKRMNLDRDARVFGFHKNLSILVRDHESLSIVKKNFHNVRTELCPDAAFNIGPLDSSDCRPNVDVLILSRRDNEKNRKAGTFEAVKRILKKKGKTYRVVDWPCVDKRRFRGRGNINRTNLFFKEGRKCVCDGGRVVVTDRLHGTVMALLLGIPHVFVDNEYGKIARYRRTFFSGKPSCSDDNIRGYHAKSWTHAGSLAIKLL